MPDDIRICKKGRAGRITLTRPRSLNAMSHDMCLAIGAAFQAWRDDPQVAVVVIDAEGDRAFCAGGDIAELYTTGCAGDFAYGRTFWRDEYRMNALIAAYSKPVVALMQGFTMGGGVGIGCHAAHRVVCESSQISMPECGIGLVPDVGGTCLLARAPGRLGAYLGLTGARMGPADALLAGFADLFIPRDDWNGHIAALEADADIAGLCDAAMPPPAGTLAALRPEIDVAFAADTLDGVVAALRASDTDFAARTLKTLEGNAPLAMACTLAILERLNDGTPSVPRALELEYRCTWRAMEHGDLIEGIRAAIIDRDRAPVWKHRLDNVPPDAVARMLEPLSGINLDLEQESSR